MGSLPHSRKRRYAKEFLLLIAQALVNQPEKVVVSEVQGSQCTILELKVAKSENCLISDSSGLHHVMGRGIERRKIFLDDADRQY